MVLLTRVIIRTTCGLCGTILWSCSTKVVFRSPHVGLNIIEQLPPPRSVPRTPYRLQISYINFQIQNAMGNILFVIFMAAGFGVLGALPPERPVFLREYTSNYYTANAYLWGKAAFEVGQERTFFLRSPNCVRAWEDDSLTVAYEKCGIDTWSGTLIMGAYYLYAIFRNASMGAKDIFVVRPRRHDVPEILSDHSFCTRCFTPHHSVDVLHIAEFTYNNQPGATWSHYSLTNYRIPPPHRSRSSSSTRY